jgi:hypothetical protein
MRRSTNKFGVIELDGKIAGVALGYDFCAEHEGGIRWRDAFGIPEHPTRKLCGIACRVTTRNTLHVEFITRKNGEVALLATPSLYGRTVEDVVKWQLSTVARDYSAPKVPVEIKKGQRKPDFDAGYPLKDVRCAWSDSDGFLIIGQTDRGKQAVKVVYDALNRLELAVGYGVSDNPFDRGGINLVDIKYLPQDSMDRLRQGDLDWLALQEAVDATGIKARLAKAGRGFYALAPKFVGDELKLFLNPQDQKNNNFGWYTVKELDQWIKGDGPIPKANTKEQA